MEMKKEYFDLLQQHLDKKIGEEPRCPKCGGTSWDAVGTYILVEWKGRITNLGTGIPVAAIICTNCFYLDMYAWLPILHGEKKDG